MQGGYILFSRLGSDLNHPLCIMAIEQKKKKKRKRSWRALEEKMFHTEEVLMSSV